VDNVLLLVTGNRDVRCSIRPLSSSN